MEQSKLHRTIETIKSLLIVLEILVIDRVPGDLGSVWGTYSIVHIRSQSGGR